MMFCSYGTYSLSLRLQIPRDKYKNYQQNTKGSRDMKIHLSQFKEYYYGIARGTYSSNNDKNTSQYNLLSAAREWRTVKNRKWRLEVFE